MDALHLLIGNSSGYAEIGVRVYTDPSFILLVIQQTLARHIHCRDQSLGKGRELGELQGNMANVYQMCKEDRGKHRGCSVAVSEGFTVNLILSHTARLSLHPTLACFPLRFLLIKKQWVGLRTNPS